jgi:hemolysin III
MQKLGNGYTLAEEIVNVITHGFGAILSIAGLSWMLYLSISIADPWRIAASVVYGLSLITLFTASAVYHSLHSHAKRDTFEILDQCAIYILIAGTYTPFLLVAMRNSVGWALFGAIWALATAGVVTLLYFRDRYPKLKLASYLVMGWLVVLVLPQIFAAVGPDAFAWMLAGGLCYTVGVAFYVRKHVEYSHAIWHVFVLAGGVCHFLAVVLHVLPGNPAV